MSYEIENNFLKNILKLRFNLNKISKNNYKVYETPWQTIIYAIITEQLPLSEKRTI